MSAFTERGTGGNRFIPADSNIDMFVAAVKRGLEELRDYAEPDRVFDLGKITIDSTRIANGKISVTVAGDLDPRRSE